MHWVTALQDVILRHAGDWWTYVVTGLLCYVDGFFPPVPSESIVIAMASLATHHEARVALWILWPLACLGAFLGDNTAFWIGRVLPLHRLFRGARGQARLQRAEHMLEQRGAEVLLSARFIPVYRVALNMVAGAVGFSYRKFLWIDALSTLAWAAFSVGVGLAAGSLFERLPLLGIGVGIVFGFALGWVVDKVAARRRRERIR